MKSLFSRNMKKHFGGFFIFISICILAYFLYSFYISSSKSVSASNSVSGSVTSRDISDTTDKWIREVTVNHDPNAIGNLFCEDGNLVGTVSQIKRKGEDIRRYFDYFAKLPGIKVVDKEYNISQVSDDTWVNTAFITWSWDDLDEPITARMTFVFRNKCIFQLHSSALPDLNQGLLDVSGTA